MNGPINDASTAMEVVSGIIKNDPVKDTSLKNMSAIVKVVNVPLRDTSIADNMEDIKTKHTLVASFSPVKEALKTMAVAGVSVKDTLKEVEAAVVPLKDILEAVEVADVPARDVLEAMDASAKDALKDVGITDVQAKGIVKTVEVANVSVIDTLEAVKGGDVTAMDYLEAMELPYVPIKDGLKEVEVADVPERDDLEVVEFASAGKDTLKTVKVAKVPANDKLEIVKDSSDKVTLVMEDGVMISDKWWTAAVVESQFVPAEVVSSMAVTSEIGLEVFENLEQEPRDVFTAMHGDNMDQERWWCEQVVKEEFVAAEIVYTETPHMREMDKVPTAAQIKTQEAKVTEASHVTIHMDHTIGEREAWSLHSGQEGLESITGPELEVRSHTETVENNGVKDWNENEICVTQWEVKDDPEYWSNFKVFTDVRLMDHDYIWKQGAPRNKKISAMSCSFKETITGDWLHGIEDYTMKLNEIGIVENELRDEVKSVMEDDKDIEVTTFEEISKKDTILNTTHRESIDSESEAATDEVKDMITFAEVDSDTPFGEYVERDKSDVLWFHSSPC